MENEKFASCRFSDFTDIKELYRSQAGAVFVARFKYDKKRYILKERTLPELGRRKDMMNEVNLLTQLDHYNVVRCEGYFRDESRKSLFIILEYCADGDLKSMLDDHKKKRQYIDEKMIWHIFTQICQGVKHLHEHGIVHRDLKTMNVMIVKNKARFEVKIADLGVSRQLSEDTMMLQTFYGTPLYLSPELIENKAYNEKTDIWSIGIILYELASLKHPFVSDTLLGLAKKVVAGKYSPIPPHYSSNLSRCIKWLLNLDFRKRPNIAQLLNFTLKRCTPGYPWTNTHIKDAIKDGDEKEGVSKKSTKQSNKSHQRDNADNGQEEGKNRRSRRKDRSKNAVDGNPNPDHVEVNAQADTDIEDEFNDVQRSDRYNANKGADMYYGDRVASREGGENNDSNTNMKSSDLLLDMDVLMAPPHDAGAAPDTTDTILEDSLDIERAQYSPSKHSQSKDNKNDDHGRKKGYRKSIDLSGVSDNGKSRAGEHFDNIRGTALDKKRWDEEPPAGKDNESRGGAAVDLKDGRVYGVEGYDDEQREQELHSRFGEKVSYKRVVKKDRSSAAADNGHGSSMNGKGAMLPVSQLRRDHDNDGGVVVVPMEVDEDIFNLPHKQYAIFDLKEEEKRKKNERAAGVGGWAADGSDFPKMSEIDQEAALVMHRSGHDTRGKKGDGSMSPRAQGQERDHLEIEGGVIVGQSRGDRRSRSPDENCIEVIAASGERRHITRRGVSARDDQHHHEGNRVERIQAAREKERGRQDNKGSDKRVYQQQELRSLSPDHVPSTQHGQSEKQKIDDDIVSRVLSTQKQKDNGNNSITNKEKEQKYEERKNHNMHRKQHMFRESTHSSPSTNALNNESAKHVVDTKDVEDVKDAKDVDEVVSIDPLRAQQVLRKELQMLRNLCKTRDFLGVSEDHAHIQCEPDDGDNGDKEEDDNGNSLINVEKRKNTTKKLLSDIARTQLRIKVLERVCDGGVISASLITDYPLLSKSYKTSSNLVSPPRSSKGFKRYAQTERDASRSRSRSPYRSGSPHRPSRRPGTAIEARNARDRNRGVVAGKKSLEGEDTPQSRGHRRPASAILASREKSHRDIKHGSNGDNGDDDHQNDDYMGEKERVSRLRSQQNEMKVRLDNARGKAGPGRDAISPEPLRGVAVAFDGTTKMGTERQGVQRVVAGSRPQTAGVLDHGLATSRAAKAKLIAKIEAKKSDLFGPATPRVSYDVDAKQQDAQQELQRRRQLQKEEAEALLKEKMKAEKDRRALSPRYAHTPKPAAMNIIMQREADKAQLMARNNWREKDNSRMARAEYDLHNAYDAYRDAVNQDQLLQANVNNDGEDKDASKNFYTGHGSRPVTAPHASTNTKYRPQNRKASENRSPDSATGSLSPRDVPRPREKPHTRNVDFRGLYDSTGLQVKSLYKAQQREKNSHNPYSSKERLPAYEQGNEKHSKFVERFAFNKNSTTRFHRVAPVSSGKAFRYVQNIRGVEEEDDGKFRLY